MHTNKSTTSTTQKMVKTDNNDDENEMLIDEGQERDRIECINTSEIFKC